MSASEAQLDVCARFGVEPDPPAGGSKLGASNGLTSQNWPVHGLRHAAGGETNGWFLWTGKYSDDAEFFTPLHWEHLEDGRPEVLPYLALPPGWRFLIAPGQEDVWFDEKLLDVG